MSKLCIYPHYICSSFIDVNCNCLTMLGMEIVIEFVIKLIRIHKENFFEIQETFVQSIS